MSAPDIPALRMSNAAAASPPNPPPTICAFIGLLPGPPEPRPPEQPWVASLAENKKLSRRRYDHGAPVRKLLVVGHGADFRCGSFPIAASCRPMMMRGSRKPAQPVFAKATAGSLPSLRKQRLVPVEGIEPPLLAEHDFESCASTSSATRALGVSIYSADGGGKRKSRGRPRQATCFHLNDRQIDASRQASPAGAAWPRADCGPDPDDQACAAGPRPWRPR